MAPNNAEANTAVSSAWIDPLRIHLESARKISVFWGASKGNTWHLVHVFHVTHTTREDSPEVITLVRPGDVEGVEHEAQAVEPEKVETSSTKDDNVEGKRTRKRRKVQG